MRASGTNDSKPDLSPDAGAPQSNLEEYRRAVAADPSSCAAWFQLGNACYRRADYTEAIGCYQKALDREPGLAEAHYNLGNIHLDLRRYSEATICFQKALDAAPDYAEAHFNMGIAYFEQAAAERAVACYRRALEIRPGMAEAAYNLGLALQDTGQVDESIDSYRRALALREDFAEALNNLGSALQEKGSLSQAEECYRQAVLLQPDYADAHYNLGNACYQRNQIDEAVRHYLRALELNPTHHKACNNIAKSYQDRRMLPQAIHWYHQALALKPDYAEARFNLATAQLLDGNFPDGWPNYEWRFRKRDWKNIYPFRFDRPRWTGEPFPGRRLYVHTEQGFGDVFQFVRYLPLVKARGGTVVLEARQALLPLLQALPGADRVVPPPVDGKPAVEFDMVVPLASLPGVFKTTLATIPAIVPYLQADPEKSSRWAARIAGDELRVGLVWAGASTDPARACPLAWFAPISTLPGIRLFGLQKGPEALEIERRGLPRGMVLDNLGRDFDDFADTAAALANLDLVISIDTSVAHLAGAMGRPGWLLLPLAADWRWLLGREDSPWYPTLRLFRQQTAGDWSQPLTRIARRLESLSRNLQRAASASGASGLLAAAADLHRHGHLVEAQVAYDRLLRAQPDHPEGLHGIGVLAHQRGNHARAIELIGKAVAMAPPSDRYFYHLGLAHLALQKHEEAREAFHRACELNPGNSDARFNLRRLLAG